MADESCSVSMQRILVLGPGMILLYGLNAVVYAVKWFGAPAGSTTADWAQSVTLLFGSALAMAVGIVYLAYSQRHVVRSRWHPWFVGFVCLLGVLVTTVQVALNQRITPSTSPFTLACMLLAVAVYMRPLASTGIFAVSAAVFYVAMGWTQPDANLLLTNRLNGMGACFLGWGVSCLFFRSFTTIALQRRQLHKVNAELVEQQEQLRRLVRLDGLTGLYNRSTFVELARLELARAKRQASATSIVLLDLDHFKRVNDTHGHPGGDAALRHVAQVAMGTVRSTDLVGRLGGEEFIILLPATTPAAARNLAEKLRSKLETTPVPWQDGHFTVTASFGIASVAPQETLEFETLYHEADKALYLAKHRGRNCVV